jgi:hypothetical protein
LGHETLLTQSSSTELNRRQSPLLRLPYELRSQIYDYNLCDDGHHIVEVQKHHLCHHENNGEMRYTPAVTSLRVCRQIHSEAWSLPLTYHTFFIVRHPNETAFVKTASDAQKAAIRSVKLECVWYHDTETKLSQLWFWDTAWHDSFDDQAFDVLDSLTELETIHLDVVVVYMYRVSTKPFEPIADMIQGLAGDLQRRVGKEVHIAVHGS